MMLFCRPNRMHTVALAGRQTISQILIRRLAASEEKSTYYWVCRIQPVLRRLKQTWVQA
jgi:hypothetical protein